MPRSNLSSSDQLASLNARREAMLRLQRIQAQLGFGPRERREVPEEIMPESRPGIVESFGETFVPRQVDGRTQPSYYDTAQSNSFLKASSGFANRIHPLAGWLVNGIGAGLLAGITSANPLIGLAAGGASLITGIPSLWSGLKDRKAQREAEERKRKQDNALIEASSGVKQLNERYNSLMQALQGLRGNTNVVNANPELIAERVNEGKVTSDAESKAQAVTDPVKRYNNLQIQRVASFSVFPIPPVVPKRALVRPTAPDRRLVRPMGAGFFSIV